MALIPESRPRVPAAVLSQRGEALQPFGNAAAEGVADLGVALSNRKQRLDNTRDRLAASAALSEFRQEEFRLFEEATRNSLDPDGFRDTHLEGLSARRDARIAEIREQSDLAGDIFEQGSLGIADSISNRSVAFEASAVGSEIAQNIGRSLNTSANTLLSNPDQYETIRDEFLGLLSGAEGVLDASAVGRLTTNAEDVLASSMVAGLIQQNPREALDLLNGESLDERLGSDQKASLLGRAQREIDRIATAARVALTGDVRDAIRVLETGAIPPNLEELQAEVAGNPAMAEVNEVLNAAVEDRSFMEGFNAEPLPDQAAQIAALATQETSTVRDVALLGRMTRQHTQALTAARNDPMVYADAVGAIDLEPIDYTDPGTLTARRDQAVIASQQVGTQVAPITRAERDNLIALLDSPTDAASGDQVAGLFASIRTGLGDDGAQRIADMIASDRPAMALAMSISADAPAVSSEIVQGERLLADNPDVKPTASQREAAVRTTYGDLFAEVPSAINPHVQAATAIYANRRIPTGDLTFDTTEFNDALELVAGGQIMADGSIVGGPLDYNGRKILPPLVGMEEDAVETLMETLTDADLVRFGNGAPVTGADQPFPVSSFDAEIFVPDAQLVTVGQGRYWVFLPGVGFIGTQSGGVYEIDLAAAATDPDIAIRISQ